MITKPMVIVQYLILAAMLLSLVAHAPCLAQTSGEPSEYREFKEFLAARENIGEYLEVFELAYSDSLVDANSDFIKRETIRYDIGGKSPTPSPQSPAPSLRL